MTKTLAQQQKDWERKQTLNKLFQEWGQATDQILNTAIDGINEARKATLKDFTTSQPEAELLNRQKCHFGRLTCTEKAQAWITKPLNYQRNPTCFNCQQDILILSKDH